jgi:hypothetical protein
MERMGQLHASAVLSSGKQLHLNPCLVHPVALAINKKNLTFLCLILF